jgi:hypothetical protein
MAKRIVMAASRHTPKPEPDCHGAVAVRIREAEAASRRTMSAEEPTEDDYKQGLKQGRVLSSWRMLRTIGNSRAAKLTVLMPLVGYLILLNDRVISYLLLSKDIFGEAAETTLTKLLAVYCGLVFVAIASVIFGIWCPLEVKRYASSEEYVAGDEPFMSERAIGVVQNQLIIGDAIARELYDGYKAHHDGRRPAQNLEQLRRRARQLVRIQLNLYYEMLDRSRPAARWAAAICYTVGLVFLLVPSAHVFWRVMKVLGHRILSIG